MKFIIPFLFIAHFSIAQNAKDLSYPEIDSLLSLYEENQELDKGIKLSIEASQKSGKQDSLCGEYLDWAAYFYELSSNNEKAIEYYNKTLEVFANVLGKETARYATVLNLFGLFYRNIGYYELALSLNLQAKNIREKVLGKEDLDFANSLNNLGGLYEEMGNFDLALPFYVQAKNIREKIIGQEHPDFAQSLNNLAGLHQNMGDFDLALPLYIQSSNIIEKVLGKDHPYLATLLNNLATLHEKMGHYDLALPFYLQAKSIEEIEFGKENPGFAILLNNLANLYQKMGNYNLALSIYIESKDIREKTIGKAHPDFASSLNNLALLHQNMGNYDLALPLFMEAKSIYEKTKGKEHPIFAQSLNNLASLHKSMSETPSKYGEGHSAKAWNLLEQAMNSSSTISLKHNFNKPWLDSLLVAPYPSNEYIDNMVYSLKLAYLLLEKDATSVTKQIYITDLATALLDKARNQVSNESDKLRMLSKSNDWLLNSLEVLNVEEHTNKAFLRADQNKSVLLLQATKSEATYRLGDLPDSLVLKDKKLLKKQSQLQAKLLEKRNASEKDSLLNELNHVNLDLNAFVKMIEKKYPKYHQLKYKQIDAKLSDIQAVLDKNTVLLEYVIGDSVLHIFLVDKTQVKWFKFLVGYEELKQRIKMLHNVLSDYKMVANEQEKSYEEYTKQAHWFYQNLIAPVLKDRQNIQNLILVTDGELGHLPFETFLVEAAPQRMTDYKELHYLVEDYNISYNYSATLFVESQLSLGWKQNSNASASKNNPNTSFGSAGQILGMAANYNLQLDSSMMEVRLPIDQWLRASLSPLPAARKEVEILQEKYQGFFAFDKEASEKVAKEKAPQYAILHFAMHGILDAKRPILSSLAFSEDNDSTESNFWQAHEISKSQLNADLVVLSACETGFGKFEAGNGIASLARAFMYAGASSLIVSLWQVNDFATSKIMENLYDNLANGMKKDEALRQAKIQYMKSANGVLAHPAFWSPFIMMGKTQPVYIKRKGGWMPWIIGGSVVLLVLGGLIVSTRKKKLAA